MVSSASEMTPAGTVSVIMIFLDAGRFIEEAIASVFAQTWPHWELLLVDDGSTDASTAIAKSYAERHPERVRYFEHPGHVNRGTGPSRNLGISNARGRYVTFLDADDAYLPQRLERHIAILNSRAEVDMVQSLCLYWRCWPGADAAEAGDEVQELPLIEADTVVEPPTLLLLMLEGETVPGSGSITLRRAAILELSGFADEFRDVYEDQVLYVKMYLRKKVYILDECLAKYRKHCGSITARAKARGDYVGGLPHAPRIALFRWIEGYMAAQGVSHPAILAAVERELWAARSPLRLRIAIAATKVLVAVRQAVKAMLPNTLRRRALAWHGGWRQRRIDRRLAKLWLPVPTAAAGRAGAGPSGRSRRFASGRTRRET
jgi:glycosyltransferase involved in cell wall biosynthesis